MVCQGKFQNKWKEELAEALGCHPVSLSRTRRRLRERLLAWMEVIAKARPELFSKAGLQYVQALPLEHLLPFAQFLAAAEGDPPVTPPS